MELQSRCFPYEKSIIFGALYDTIEVLGLRLESSNSTRGTLIVSDVGQTGKLRVALSADRSKTQTLVEVFPEDPDGDFAEAWRPVILDELAGMIRRCIAQIKDK